jgi:hypothetical protein
MMPILMLVAMALAAVILAAFVVARPALLGDVFSSSSTSSATSTPWLFLPSQEWNARGRTAPTTPPLQDNLDRLVADPVADAALAPNGLARLRAMDSMGALGGGGGMGLVIGGGSGSGGSLLRQHPLATVAPTHVRPPIDRTYRRVGTITRRRGDGQDVADANLDILPLMGQWLHGDKWRYFTVTGGVGGQLPVERASGSGGCSTCPSRRRLLGGGAACTSEYGCGELYTDDVLAVPGFKDQFVVNIHENGTFYG